MLHTMTEDGMLHFHCDTPSCDYHNCAGWHEERVCVHHAGRDQEGRTRTIHVSHPEVRHPLSLVGEPNRALVQLPACEGCGALMTLKVGFTPEELAGVAMVEVIEERQVEGESMQTLALRKALHHRGIEIAPVMERRVERRVLERRPPYWLAHHLRLAEHMMKENGKT